MKILISTINDVDLWIELLSDEHNRYVEARLVIDEDNMADLDVTRLRILAASATAMADRIERDRRPER